MKGLNAPTFGWPTTVVRNWSFIDDRNNNYTKGLQGPDCGISPEPRSFQVNLHLFKPVGHGSPRGILSYNLGSIGGGLSGATEIALSSTAPGNHVPTLISHGDLGVVKSGNHVDNAMSNIFAALSTTNFDITQAVIQ